MSYVALPMARREMPNFGVAALIALALASVVVGFTDPEAITAEYETTASLLLGP
jgi:hypothetical protein